MDNPEEKPKPPQSKTVQICSVVFIALGIGIFQAVAPQLFPTPPGGGFNMMRIVAAGVVGAVCAVIGAGVGGLIDKLRQ
jgi:hypothetical protein